MLITYIHNLSHTLDLNHNGIISINTLSHLMNHIHFTYELCNTHNYSIVFKIILTCRVPTVDPITILVALKRSYNCVIAQFIVHNSIDISQYTSISPLITGPNYHILKFESPFHNLNITIYTKILSQHRE